MNTFPNEDDFGLGHSVVESPDEPVELTDETVRWRARDASFMAGRWSTLSKCIPTFSIEDLKAKDDGPSNPHIRTVVRQPLTVTEQPIPVGVVSNAYCLAQHKEVVTMCLKGLEAHGIDPQTLRCEVGLTPLGEWMNFRAYFPERYSHTPSDGNKLALRLECFNSVDGSSRMVILLGWFRFICANGLIIGETKAALRDIHDENLNLDIIPEIIAKGLTKVKSDLERIALWDKSLFELPALEYWIDAYLAEQLGKKAACRTLHICRDGMDVEITDPFTGGKASEKSVKVIGPVPGAATPAKSIYHVSQALSWLATQRRSAEERLEWQAQIPELIENLLSYFETARSKSPKTS
jgi:hypothetical protein